MRSVIIISCPHPDVAPQPRNHLPDGSEFLILTAWAAVPAATVAQSPEHSKDRWLVCLAHNKLLTHSFSWAQPLPKQARLTLVDIATLKLALPQLCLQPQTLASDLDHTHIKMGSEEPWVEEVGGRLRGTQGSEVSLPFHCRKT